MSLGEPTDCPFAENRVCKWWSGRVSEDQAFLIAPSDEHLADVRRHIQRIVKRHVAECKQAIDEPPSGQDIWCENICRQILLSQFVVVLLDESQWRRRKHQLPPDWSVTELNANVYFEYGLAMGMRIPTVCCLEEGVELPFDTGWLSMVFYSEDFYEDDQSLETFEHEFNEAIQTVYPSLSYEQARRAADLLWEFYLGRPPHRGRADYQRTVAQLQRRGFAAWRHVSNLVRASKLVQPRIEEGVRRILTATCKKGYPPKKIPEYTRVCGVEGSYLPLIETIRNWDSPTISDPDVDDVAKITEETEADEGWVPSAKDWSFAEPECPSWGDVP